MKLGTLTARHTQAIRQIPRAEVCFLWVNDFYDVPLQGMAEFDGRRSLFDIIDRDKLGTEDEIHRYWLIALSPEELGEEERWQDLFCRKVGTHFDYIGRAPPAKVDLAPNDFYGPYSQRLQPCYADNEVIGWFWLHDETQLTFNLHTGE